MTSDILVFNPMKMSSKLENPKVFPHKMENQQRNKFEEITNPLKIFFDFMYYSLICPVRFLKDPANKQFYGKQWLPQKVNIINILFSLQCSRFIN